MRSACRRKWALIRHLDKRLLQATRRATWGLSPLREQVIRSIFGAPEAGVESAAVDAGFCCMSPSSIEVPINGMFVMVLTLLITIGVADVI